MDIEEFEERIDKLQEKLEEDKKKMKDKLYYGVVQNSCILASVNLGMTKLLTDVTYSWNFVLFPIYFHIALICLSIIIILTAALFSGMSKS